MCYIFMRVKLECSECGDYHTLKNFGEISKRNQLHYIDREPQDCAEIVRTSCFILHYVHLFIDP